MNILRKIKNGALLLEHRQYLMEKRKKLTNRTATILSSNCNGAFILHDMGCRFNSPTVNLVFAPKDYLKFVRNPQYYLDAVPVELKGTGNPFPVGVLNDILVYFMHYETFEEAKAKWIERSKRVDMSNVYLMMTERNGCTYEDLLAFDALPYEHKVVFTARPYPEIASAYYIPGCEVGNEVRVLSEFKAGDRLRRWLDDFDYVGFLNE